MPQTDPTPLWAYLREHWVLVLATRASDEPSDAPPYPTPLFYSVVPSCVSTHSPWLVFASKPTTRHGVHLGAGPTLVAAGSYLETQQVECIRGVQLRGEVVLADRLVTSTVQACHDNYVERHPVARSLLGEHAAERLYVLAITWAKLTDHRLGFGARREWSFPAPHWPWGEVCQ